MGALDFAGGIVIHTTAGVGSLIIALMMGQRKDFDKYHGEFPPSNLPMAAMGAALLWMGWFGFNAGSALTSGSLAVSAVASTQIAACCAAMVWLSLSWLKNKPSSVAVINGVIAGLAGITPASGYVSSQSSIVIGFVLGFASYYSVVLLKHKLRIDDALDVSSVHGVTGVVGSLAIGFCSQKSLNADGADGLFFGNPRLLGIQVLAVVVAAGWSAFWTFIIAWGVEKTVGLKISEEEEVKGLDLVEHGEFGTNLSRDDIGDSIAIYCSRP
jgi:Amt family ammonium transporter